MAVSQSMNVSSMRGRVALVTGASSGIGRESARLFARKGASVVVADIDSVGGEETARSIGAEQGDAVFIKADVTQAAEVEAMIQRTMDLYGRLDFAHNNAGISPGYAPLADISEDAWNRILDINLRGVWLCLKYEIRQMIQQRRGAIVNTSSVAGIVGFRRAGAYSASKHGVVGLTRSAPLDYADVGIRVNAVCPGATRTPIVDRALQQVPEMLAQISALHPLGRIAEANEVAAAAVWLCSDAASFVTGQALAVDGGFTSH